MSRSNPFAFTEQGIYMLMTVLKGEQAVAQSKALIRLFKQMKDYIIEENRTLSQSSIFVMSSPKISFSSNSWIARSKGRRDTSYSTCRFQNVNRS